MHRKPPLENIFSFLQLAVKAEEIHKGEESKEFIFLTL